MNTREIERLLEEFDFEEYFAEDENFKSKFYFDENPWDNWHQFYDSSYWIWRETESPMVFVSPDLAVQVIEHHGGEGEGDKYYLIFKVIADGDTRYFKMDGYYSSYDGGYFDGPFYEVKPVERMVTFWEELL